MKRLKVTVSPVKSVKMAGNVSVQARATCASKGIFYSYHLRKNKKVNVEDFYIENAVEAA